MSEWVAFSVYRTCPFAKPAIVAVSLKTIKLCRMLSRHLDTEWLVYAKADWVSDDVVVVHSPYVPLQVVSYAHVEVKESVELNAVIHTHPGGGSAFSSVDETYINSNADVSLLWSHNWFSVARVRKRMPCGEYLWVDCENIAIAVNAPDNDADIDINDVLSRIVKEPVKVRVENRKGANNEIDDYAEYVDIYGGYTV